MKKNFKRKVKKFNRKSRISKGISFLGKHAKAKYTQSFQIFALQVNDGISMYGFLDNFATSSLAMPATAQLWTDSAFIAMCSSYGLMRIHGMSVNIARQLPVNQTAIAVATPFSIGLSTNNQQVVTSSLTTTAGIAANNYDIANHIKYVNENEIGWWSKYYSFDRDVICARIADTDQMVPLPIGKAWIPASASSYMTGGLDLFLLIGFDLPPTFASTGSNQAVVVAQMDLTYYVEFAQQRGATAVAP